jgi:hypothetical protein
MTNDTHPDLLPFPTHGCDWGDCDDDSPWLRWAPDLGTYLPVCERHAHNDHPSLRLITNQARR